MKVINLLLLILCIGTLSLPLHGMEFHDKSTRSKTTEGEKKRKLSTDALYELLKGAEKAQSENHSTIEVAGSEEAEKDRDAQEEVMTQFFKDSGVDLTEIQQGICVEDDHEMEAYVPCEEEVVPHDDTIGTPHKLSGKKRPRRKTEKRGAQKTVNPSFTPYLKNLAEVAEQCKKQEDGSRECLFCGKNFKNIHYHLRKRHQKECTDLTKSDDEKRLPSIHSAPYDLSDHTPYGYRPVSDDELFAQVIAQGQLDTTISKRTLKTLRKISEKRRDSDASSKPTIVKPQEPEDIFKPQPEYRACIWCQKAFLTKDLEKHQQGCPSNPRHKK